MWAVRALHLPEHVRPVCLIAERRSSTARVFGRARVRRTQIGIPEGVGSCQRDCAGRWFVFVARRPRCSDTSQTAGRLRQASGPRAQRTSFS